MCASFPLCSHYRAIALRQITKKNVERKSDSSQSGIQGRDRENILERWAGGNTIRNVVF